MILDNYAAHKHDKVRAWLDRHPRWTFHFTPTSSSWLNAVEGFFAKLSKRRLKHGVFRSVVDLQAAINRFVAEHNENPKPFIWTRRPRQDHRSSQTWASNVGFNPLATAQFKNSKFLSLNGIRASKNHGPTSTYLYEECRIAVAHGAREKHFRSRRPC